VQLLCSTRVCTPLGSGHLERGPAAVLLGDAPSSAGRGTDVRALRRVRDSSLGGPCMPGSAAGSCLALLPSIPCTDHSWLRMRTKLLLRRAAAPAHGLFALWRIFCVARPHAVAAQLPHTAMEACGMLFLRRRHWILHDGQEWLATTDAQACPFANTCW
jgi:hypothetical protein